MDGKIRDLRPIKPNRGKDGVAWYGVPSRGTSVEFARSFASRLSRLPRKCGRDSVGSGQSGHDAGTHDDFRVPQVLLLACMLRQSLPRNGPVFHWASGLNREAIFLSLLCWGAGNAPSGAISFWKNSCCQR